MEEQKLLITGFEPFGGQEINPSWEAVAALPDQIGPFVLTRLLLPVEFGRAARLALEQAETLCPDVVLCIGQAGGRRAVTPEAAGLNLREAEIPDNAGAQPQDEPCVPGGDAAYFATVPVRRMVQAIQAEGLPGQLSCSAGAYVCNDLLYTLLHAFRGSNTRVGFIHLPFLPGQGGADAPCLTLEEDVRALEAAIRAMAEE